MSDFVQLVRNGFIPQPTQRLFTLERWRQAYEEIPERSDADTRLYITGEWAFTKLEAIRRKLAPFLLDGLPKETLLKLFVGNSNREGQLIGSAHINVGEDNVFIVEQAVQGKLAEGNVIGNPAHPNSLLMTSVDGVAFPVRRTLLSNARPASVTFQDEEVLKRVRIMAFLGQFYDGVEAFWMQSLWNGWYIEANDDVDILRPPREAAPIIAAVSEYRRDTIAAESAHFAVDEWRFRLDEKAKTSLIASAPQVLIKKSGKGQKFEIRSRTEDDPSTLTLLLKRLSPLKGYYEPLLEVPLPALGKITLMTLLSAWEVLYALAESLKSRLPADKGEYTIKKLERFAPTVYAGQVTDLFQKWLAISVDDAKRILDFFTYKPKENNEFWATPLIKLRDELLLPLLIPLLYGNLERTIELWMKMGELDLGAKGYLFEEYARGVLNDAISTSRVLRNSGVYPCDLVLEGEQIDLLLWIKNVILVGEAKCILFPSMPLEYHNYFNTLEDATEQIRRKAKVVRSNRKGLLDQLGISDRVDEKNVTIIPFILVNQPFGVGRPVDNVPVLDLLLLKRYLRDGEWEKVTVRDRQGQYKAVETITLYTNEDEAVKNVIEYLYNPPQLKQYWGNIKMDFHKHPLLDDQDRKFVSAKLEVELPLPKTEFKIGTS